MLYLAARFLGMDAKTWDSQPFWAQRVYAEGLHLERPWQVKLDINPETWWSPLDPSWEEFGELNMEDDSQELKEIPFNEYDDEQDEPPHVSLAGLPSVESLGAPITRIPSPVKE
jgi:hypothetical protein